MIHVFLDDMRPCPKGFTLARNAEECLLLLRECEVDVLSLDYDLGPDEPNGFDVVRMMIGAGAFPRSIYLHTSSDFGRSQMFQMLYLNKPAATALHRGPIPPEQLEKLAQTANR